MKKCILSLTIFISVLLIHMNSFAGFFNDEDFDGSDLAKFAKAYGSVTGSENYDSDSDFIGDGDVDKVDLGGFASCFGRVDIKIPDAIEEVGALGGNIMVSDPQKQLYGTEIQFPPGALLEDTLIILQQPENMPILPGDQAPAGPVVEFMPNGINFISNIRATIPYNDTDNDGLVDYTGTPENDTELKTFDIALGEWQSVPILDQDIVANTITFETSHFSIYKTTINPTSISPDTLIFTIPGMKLGNTFLSELIPFWDHGISLRDSYLREAIVEQMGLNITYGDVYPYPWDGYAESTPNRVEEIVLRLKKKYCEAKKNGKKFIIVTHSWGTVLGTLALQYAPEVIPDLIITLSSPLGSDNYDNSLNTLFCTNYPLIDIYTVGEIQNFIEGYVGEKIQQTQQYMLPLNPSGLRYVQWINYWDDGDIISGQLFLPPIADEEVFEGLSERSCTSTSRVHALTSLNERQFEAHNVDLQEGRDFRDRVQDAILSAPNIADSDCDGIYNDGDASGTPGDNPCTDGNTVLCDDNCPNDWNPAQTDTNNDGIGDACGIPAISITSVDGGNISPTTLGWEFSVGPSPLRISHLGFFDHRQLSPAPSFPPIRDHFIGLWHLNGTLLSTSIVTPSSGLTDKFRFEPITPTLLIAGTNYILGAENDVVDPFWYTPSYSTAVVDGWPWLQLVKYRGIRLDKPNRQGLNFPAVSATSLEAGLFGPNFMFERMPCTIWSHKYEYNENYFIDCGIKGTLDHIESIEGPNIIDSYYLLTGALRAVFSQPPLIGEIYKYQICYNQSCSEFDEVRYAFTGVNENSATLDTPIQGATINSENFPISWSQTLGSSSFYAIVVSEDDTGIRIWQKGFSGDTTSTIYNIDGTATTNLQPGKIYSIYLFAYDENFSVFSTGINVIYQPSLNVFSPSSLNIFSNSVPKEPQVLPFTERLN